MEKAANKYKILKTKELWEAPSPQEEKLIAMEARLAELKKKFNKKKQQSNGDGGGNSNGKNKGKGKGKGTKKGKKEKKDLPAWHFVRPSDECLTKPREWEGKPWYWCSKETGGKCAGQYRRHLPKDCKGTAKASGKKRNFNGNVIAHEAIGDDLNGGYVSE